MKKSNSILICCILFATMNSYAQVNPEIDTSLVKNLTQNFAVPDLPAFNALDVAPGNLLRPSTPKEFAVVAGNFYGGNTIIIPKSLAVEVSPILITKSKSLTIQDYQKCPAFYNLRISVGTLRDSTNASKIAIGLRTTIFDHGDIKYKSNLDTVVKFLEKRNNGRVEYITKNLKTPGDDAELKKLSSEYDALFNDTLNYVVEKGWNAARLDVALAYVGASPDSTAKNIRFSSLTFWSTLALPIKRNGQLLIGFCLINSGSTDKSYTTLSLPVRAYFGNNGLKGFLEGQYTYKQSDQTNQALVSLGCEYKLTNSVWAQFSAGMNRNFTDNTSNLTSDFRLIYTIPGKL